MSCNHGELLDGHINTPKLANQLIEFDKLSTAALSFNKIPP